MPSLRTLLAGSQSRFSVTKPGAFASSKLSFNLFPNTAQAEQSYDNLYSTQSAALTAGKRSAADK